MHNEAARDTTGMHLHRNNYILLGTEASSASARDQLHPESVAPAGTHRSHRRRQCHTVAVVVVYDAASCNSSASLSVTVSLAAQINCI